MKNLIALAVAPVQGRQCRGALLALGKFSLTGQNYSEAGIPLGSESYNRQKAENFKDSPKK